MKSKRSSSVPNLRNYLNSIKCAYCCKDLTFRKDNQSTQTDIEINKINQYDLRVPSERSLHHQVTKDSGIEINTSKSKTNSYSSTPIDPSDLALITSSTRNNSLDRQDSIMNEQKTIINEIPKENDVLEKSLQSFDKEFSKYNIFAENDKEQISEIQSAINKRKQFKGNFVML